MCVFSQQGKVILANCTLQHSFSTCKIMQSLLENYAYIGGSTMEMYKQNNMEILMAPCATKYTEISKMLRNSCKTLIGVHEMHGRMHPN